MGIFGNTLWWMHSQQITGYLIKLQDGCAQIKKRGTYDDFLRHLDLQSEAMKMAFAGKARDEVTKNIANNLAAAGSAHSDNVTAYTVIILLGLLVQCSLNRDKISSKCNELDRLLKNNSDCHFMVSNSMKKASEIVNSII